MNRLRPNPLRGRKRAPNVAASRPVVQLFLLSCLAAFASGCVFLTPTEVQDMRVDINKMKNDMSRLRSDQSKMLKELKYDLEQIEKNVEAQRRLQLEFSKNVDGKLASIQEDLDTLSFDLRKSSATDGAAPPPSSGGGDAETEIADTGASPLSTPEQEKRLRTADEEFHRGDYDKAIELYSAFLQDYTDSPIAPKAAYNLARCYHETKQYEYALEGFKHIIATYPASDIIPQTLYSRAVCEYNLQQFEKVRATLNAIQSQYPDYMPERIEAFQKQLP